MQDVTIALAQLSTDMCTNIYVFVYIKNEFNHPFEFHLRQ